MNKTESVLRHLQEQGTITSLEAIEHYSATRLSSIIHTLRKRGYRIDTETIEFTDRFGSKSYYGKYIYKGFLNA